MVAPRQAHLGSGTIRHLHDGVIDRLKSRAKAIERSLEGEVRHLRTREATGDLGTAEFMDRVDLLAAAHAWQGTDREHKPHPGGPVSLRDTADTSLSVPWFLESECLPA